LTFLAESGETTENRERLSLDIFRTTLPNWEGPVEADPAAIGYSRRHI